MSMIKIENYIVLDSDAKMSKLKQGRSSYEYTVGGAVIYPVGSIIPVIQKSRGCIGLAKVEQITVRESSTTISFTVVTKDGNFEGIYNAYRMSVSFMPSSSRDIYDDEDSIGAGGDEEGSFSTEDLKRIFGGD